MEKSPFCYPEQGAATVPIIRINMENEVLSIDDMVIIEHHINVYINQILFMEMTCSPFHLQELIQGFLYTEGYIADLKEIKDIQIEEDGSAARILLKRDVANREDEGTREVASYGKKYLYSDPNKPVVLLKPINEIVWNAGQLLPLANDYFQGSYLFQKTGGVHSCTLTTMEGKKLYSCDDIGRHNALDKVVGMALSDGVDLSNLVLFTSGRVPVDMVKKMIRSRIPVVISHSAVTDQAVKLAKDYKLTLIGFARNNRCNLYSGQFYR